MTWREPQPGDATPLLDDEDEGHWPDTINDEMARDDAPDQEYDDE